MKTRLFTKYLLLAACAVLFGACEDHRDDHMEEFQTMVYFRNGGEQSLTLFRTGEDGFYKIPVCKSGRDLDGTATAVVIPFDEAQMMMYNIQNETEYSLIPSNLFFFTDADRNALSVQDRVDLTFTSKDAYQVVYLSLKTTDLSTLMAANPDKVYVLGMQVFSDENVSDDINLIILKPEIEIPLVSLVAPGVESHKYTSSSPASQTYHNTVSLNVDENRWDFTCTIEPADAAWLETYNYNNGKKFELLPPEAYELSTTTLSFPKGTLDASFDVTINREGMDMLKEYAIPIVLTACSKTEFAIDETKNVFVLNVRLDPDQITLDESMVSVSASHTGDGGGAPALVDGRADTYWHSLYSNHNGDPVYGEYVDIALKSELKAIVLEYMTRHNNNNGVPTHIQVYVRPEGSATWTMIGEEQTEEMAGAGTAQTITLSVMKSETSFKYIRMAIVEAKSGDLRLQGTTNFTALAEISLYGTN